MNIKKLTDSHKIDLILGKVTKLETSVGKLETSVGKLETSVGKLEKNQIKMQKDIDDLIDITSDTLQLAAKTADRVDKIESHLKEKTGFTPFTSGAFAA